MAAVLVCGSVGRGSEDEWSDLDLIVATFDDPAKVAASAAEAAHFGELGAWVDTSCNAPLGATQAFARYFTSDGLILVDWNAWPLRAVRTVEHARTLWTRPGVEISHFDGTFHELVASQPQRQMPPYTPAQRAAWELCMCHLAVSLPARRRDARAALASIGSDLEPGPDPLAQLGAIAEHIVKLQPWVAPRLFDASLDRVEAATAALRQ